LRRVAQRFARRVGTIIMMVAVLAFALPNPQPGKPPRITTVMPAVMFNMRPARTVTRPLTFMLMALLIDISWMTMTGHWMSTFRSRGARAAGTWPSLSVSFRA